MVLPTTIARKAIRTYHEEGEAAAIEYVRQSKLTPWSGSRHRSLASSASNVIDGISAYFTADQADGRPVIGLGREVVVPLRSGPVKARLDAILEGSNGLVGRVVLWDGPDFTVVQAPLIASAYSEAMRQLFPEKKIESICVWQGRRQTREEIAFRTAQAQLRRADEIAATL